MTVLPVVLKHIGDTEKKLLVYAMLDNCSQETFINEDILDMLNTGEQTKTTITVKTLSEESTEESIATEGLIVSALKPHLTKYPTSNSINLPVAYSRAQLPINKGDIPTAEKLRCWKRLFPILKEIPNYDENILISLLIGGDCPRALEP